MKTAIRERPIIFNAEMIRAILDGRKTQTRRVMKPQPFTRPVKTVGGYYRNDYNEKLLSMKNISIKWDCPYGIPGDKLWVRETFYATPNVKDSGMGILGFVADGDWPHNKTYRRVSSIYMPRWASRITLEITDVRVERVQDISGHDCINEGMNLPDLDFGDEYSRSSRPAKIRVEPEGKLYMLDHFKQMWDSINAKKGFGWDVNPWVWAITFKKVD